MTNKLLSLRTIDYFKSPRQAGSFGANKQYRISSSGGSVVRPVSLVTRGVAQLLSAASNVAAVIKMENLFKCTGEAPGSPPCPVTIPLWTAAIDPAIK